MNLERKTSDHILAIQTEPARAESLWQRQCGGCCDDEEDVVTGKRETTGAAKATGYHLVTSEEWQLHSLLR